MDNIIPFPKSFDNFKEVELLISKVCQKAGLSQQMITCVTEEYHEYYNQLSTQYEGNALQIPSQLGLNQQQADLILQAHNKSLEGIFQHHSQQVSHACHIIIGLLIREQLSLLK